MNSLIKKDLNKNKTYLAPYRNIQNLWVWLDSGVAEIWVYVNKGHHLDAELERALGGAKEARPETLSVYSLEGKIWVGLRAEGPWVWVI